ncbi:hypothetical protein RFI_16076 [Reticulomyxa filosa]|uniref:Uncharacterized protein n=1 Tax=Reticulomyxa filosa TaxID=46433 RepID=X6N743_RETFI|nr:hypothetical protein RFI_16076 [Reticulomyxa filosa]|eukprot:ETO21127.1 hypothetical protein RFI_16076 [Reticulomyxa filosa]
MFYPFFFFNVLPFFFFSAAQKKKNLIGILRADAMDILQTMAKYPDVFIDHMLVEELDIQPVDDDESAIKNGLVTMSSFMVFGVVPLLAYVITLPINFPDYNPTFLISIILTVLTLLLLGGIKGKMTESSIWKSAFFVMLNGVIAAAASYLIGFLLAQLINTQISLFFITSTHVLSLLSILKNLKRMLRNARVFSLKYVYC